MKVYNGKIKIIRSFIFTFHYIDDVFSVNNSRFVNCVDCIYPIELEIKNTTDTDASASYLDLYLKLEIDRERRLKMKLLELFTENTSSI
jgi:hypothetical protein